ncbi:MAG TPA: hypothetical protein ENI76_05825 [Ignavibacteria bacterium]|nr:hypothetical protein [Ignavibacteria bacterium]
MNAKFTYKLKDETFQIEVNGEKSRWTRYKGIALIKIGGRAFIGVTDRSAELFGIEMPIETVVEIKYTLFPTTRCAISIKPL